MPGLPGPGRPLGPQPQHRGRSTRQLRDVRPAAPREPPVVNRGSSRPHWSERSWWNPRRWLAAPLLIGAAGATVAWAGAVVQALRGGFSLWGLATLAGLVVVVGAIAWAQADLNEIQNNKRKASLREEREQTGAGRIYRSGRI